MRVGLLTYALDRPLSGISRYTIELARALRALAGGPDLVLLTAGGPGPLGRGEGLERAPLRGCSRWPALIAWGSLMVPLAARQSGVALVHDPSGAAPLLFGAAGARTVVTVHDVFAWSCPGHSTLIDTLLYRHWLPRVLPRVDAVITVSQVSKADIVRHLHVPTTKVHVVYRWLHAGLRRAHADEIAAARSRHGLPEDYVLFVGSVEKRKNVHGLLQAYALLNARGNPPPLVVVGVQRMGTSGLSRMPQDLGLTEKVHFAGYIPDEDLPAIYSGADLSVFPSLYEGFGLPPLEAMACGTPVVCSDAGSLPEVVGDAAITVDPYDVEGLAEAMRRVLADRDLAEDLRSRGLERARMFSWEKAARETMEVYREVLR